jgi:hypothetical protein
VDEAECHYSPEVIDRVLKAWPAYESRAEGYRSSLPDALRPSHAPVMSGNDGAVICADIAHAMVACLEIGGVEWRTVEARRLGASFGQMAADLHVGKQTAHAAYWQGITRMAQHLGWVAPRDEGGANDLSDMW